MTRIKLRRATAAEWTAADPVLAQGEPGVEYDTLYMKIGNGTLIWSSLPYQLGGFSATATLDFSSISAGASQELTVTVTGAAVGNVVILGAPAAIETGLVWNGYVSATNTVKVRISNITGSSINPASASWRVSAVR